MIAALVVIASLLAPACYQMPVEAPVVDPFRAPACAYCAGNRGLEYRTTPGQPVVAAATGTVAFNGVVAGVRYVVVRQADGLLATYGRLVRAEVVVGDAVSQGGPIGAASDQFYFGLREDGRYVDPAPRLGVVLFRPRLLPTDGGPARAPPIPRRACAVDRASSAWHR